MGLKLARARVRVVEREEERKRERRSERQAEWRNGKKWTICIIRLFGESENTIKNFEWAGI